MAEGGTLRIGLFGIGLAAYWDQFAGLEDRLKAYVSRVAERLSGPDRQIINFGLVDSPERAFEVGQASSLLSSMRDTVTPQKTQSDGSQSSQRTLPLV